MALVSRLSYLLILIIVFLLSACTSSESTHSSPSKPEWVADAVFYQIFPTRFRNGDPGNDPPHSSLEFPEFVPDSWKVSSWTSDWYSRDEWEVEKGDDFYDSVFDRRYGGDIAGIIEKLDYLADLGVNALYFNPLFFANSLHKYDGNSFHHIDPYFGPDPEGDLDLIAAESADPSSWSTTSADLLFYSLIEEAHIRGIRIVIDGVFNHTGRDFFAFADIMENQEASDYKDWYIINSFDDPNTAENEFDYEGWWGVETLPLFADTPDSTDLHPGPKNYVFNATKRWMDPNGDGDPSDGIDGWRLDVAPDVPVKFWSDWNLLVREINPEAYTVAEAWDDASHFLERGGFSATMNYHAFAFPVKGFLIDNLLSASDFLDLIESRRSEYPTSMQYALQNLIDSHDTDRVASMIVNAKPVYDIPERFDYDHNVSPRWYDAYDVRKPNNQERSIQKLVALMQFTFPGAPMLYYGTEAGMWGADDPDDRMPMVWSDLNYVPQSEIPRNRPRTVDSVKFENDLYEFYKSLAHFRHQEVALRYGSFMPTYSSNEQNLVFFTRTLGTSVLLIGINRGLESTTTDLSSIEGVANKKLKRLFSTVTPFRDSSHLNFQPSALSLRALEGAVFLID